MTSHLLRPASDDAVLLRVENGVAEITLNREARSNAIDLTMAKELANRIVTVGQLTDVRVVLLRGHGRHFCAGGDMKSIYEAASRAAAARELAEALSECVTEIHALRIPVVSAVTGAAAGAGLAFVLASDIVIAASSARFVAAFAKMGLTPDSGVSWYLPRVVGMRRAMDFLLGDGNLNASKAEDWGLVSRVVDDTFFNDFVADYVRSIAEGPWRTLGRTKAILQTTNGHSIVEHLALEVEAVASSVGDVESIERLDAFATR